MKLYTMIYFSRGHYHCAYSMFVMHMRIEALHSSYVEFY